MIKLVVSDLDGTLLTDYCQELPEHILRLIRRLKDRGILFAAASGRQYANIRRLFAPLGYEIPLIAENGSLCVYKGRTLATGEIPAATIRHILDGLMDYRARFHTGHCILSVRETYYTDARVPQFTDYMLNTMHNHITVVPDLYAVKEPLLKAAICDFNGTRELEPFFRDRLKGEIRVATSARHWIDFIAPCANKGTALAALLEFLHIAPEECVCFGDQQNDIEMLKLGGVSFAMKTAAPGVAEYADAQVDSVLPVLEKLCEKGSL